MDNTPQTESDDSMPTPASAPNVYIGLSERSKLWVIGIGAVIASVNLLVAWFIAYQTLNSIRLVDADVIPFKMLMTNMSMAPENYYDLSARSMHLITMTKMIANKQGIILTCFGGAFALAAIGFSLFIIGADGAFKISASSNSKAKIVLSGTTPGILCFLICGWLITQGVQQKSSMDLPYLNSASSQANLTSTKSNQPCDRIDLNQNCYTEVQWQEMLNKK